MRHVRFTLFAVRFKRTQYRLVDHSVHLQKGLSPTSRGKAAKRQSGKAAKRQSGKAAKRGKALGRHEEGRRSGTKTSHANKQTRGGWEVRHHSLKHEAFLGDKGQGVAVPAPLRFKGSAKGLELLTQALGLSLRLADELT